VAQFETKEEAAAAIEGLNGTEFVDKVLSANWAFLNTGKRR
jgi:RNA recognition motif-containing protein